MASERAIHQAVLDDPRASKASKFQAARCIEILDAQARDRERQSEARLRPEEKALFDKCKPKSLGPKQATQRGCDFVMPVLTPDEAKARLAELEREGR